MISHRRVVRMFQRSATRIGSIAASAGSVAGLLALPIVVPPMEAQQQAAVRVPTAVLGRYVGEYVYPNGAATWVVSRTADTLFHEAAGRRYRYEPLSETLFRVGPVSTAEFVIDQAGEATTQILSDGVALEFRLRRKGSPPEPPAAAQPPAAAVRVPRSVLQRYVGVYDYLPGQMERTDLRVIVALRGDTLTRWMIGKEQVLVPISESRFSVAGTSLVTEFVVDEAGVTIVMGSGFQQMLARLTGKR
jgi:hypothetical protein